jgi:cytoskeletal protein CcmA (bactofilin family)
MKHFLLVSLFVLLPIQSLMANTVVRSGETVTLTDNQSIEGSYYVVGGTVALAGKVTGDTTVIGGNVTIGGEINQDLAVLAGTVNMQSPVTEDVRIVAGQVTITEDVGGDLVVIAGKLTISSEAKITGDVLFYGGELVVEGSIGGKLLGGAENVRVDTEVMGGVDMTTRGLTLGEQANVTGNVEYTSDADFVRAPGAVITGDVVKNAPLMDETSETNARSIAIMFLVSLFATLSIYLLFRRRVESFAQSIRTGLLVKTIVGFVAVFMAPLLIIILIVSILGSLVGLIALCLFALLLVLTLPLIAVTAGSLLSSMIDAKSKISAPYILLGAVVAHICLLVPLFGSVIILFLFLATIGTLVDTLYKKAR